MQTKFILGNNFSFDDTRTQVKHANLIVWTVVSLSLSLSLSLYLSHTHTHTHTHTRMHEESTIGNELFFLTIYSSLVISV